MYSDASIHDTTECHFIIAYIAVIQLVLERTIRLKHPKAYYGSGEGQSPYQCMTNHVGPPDPCTPRFRKTCNSNTGLIFEFIGHGAWSGTSAKWSDNNSLSHLWRTVIQGQ